MFPSRVNFFVKKPLKALPTAISLNMASSIKIPVLLINVLKPREWWLGNRFQTSLNTKEAVRLTNSLFDLVIID